jgi:cytochrome c5
MKLPWTIRAFLLVPALVALAAAAQSQAQQQSKKLNVMITQKQQAATDESAQGEKLFETNCGRCHVPPEDLSPREAKAVVRKMRVRANLTAEEERLILKYLAP